MCRYRAETIGDTMERQSKAVQVVRGVIWKEAEPNSVDSSPTLLPKESPIPCTPVTQRKTKCTADLKPQPEERD